MLTKSHRKTIARAGLMLALATTSASTAAVASADTGPLPGGCHMVSNSDPTTTGLDQMMANASSTGAKNMISMLYTFYPSKEFCGVV